MSAKRPNDRPELLTLWRLRTRPEIHIEDEPTYDGVVALCGFRIPTSADARSSHQPETRVWRQKPLMCRACMAGLEGRRRRR